MSSGSYCTPCPPPPCRDPLVDRVIAIQALVCANKKAIADLTAELPLVAVDGNHVPILRIDPAPGVAPTALEIPAPTWGDSASILLSNGSHEFWKHNGTTWALVYTVSSAGAIKREEIVAGRIKVTFEGSTGDVTGIYAQGLATINVGNNARLLSARIYGANADLNPSNQGFEVRVNDPNLGNDVDDMNYPIGLTLVRNNQTNPTQSTPMVLNVDPDPGFRIYDVSGTGMTGQFTSLNSTVTHALLLNF